MLETLTRLQKLELDHEDWDLRGWPLRDTNGHTIGTIAELIVDTSTQNVSQVMLRDGRKFAAHDVLIDDYFATLDERVTRPSSAKKAMDAELRQKVATTGKAVPVAGRTPTTTQRPKVEPLLHERRELREVDLGADVVIPVIEEELDIGTRRYDAGGVRVQTHVAREPIARSVIVREEHVTVERKHVDKPLRVDEAEARLADREIEMKAVSEVPTREKRARVVEEIVITKDVSERREKIADSLRRTEVDITELPGTKHESGREPQKPIEEQKS